MTSAPVSTEGLPGLVSVDDHLVEPPTLWVERLPARYRDVGPRVERWRVAEAAKEGLLRFGAGNREVTLHADSPNPEWVDIWFYEDGRFPMFRSYAIAGTPYDEAVDWPITYDDMRPGFFQVKERLDDMDLDGVDISLCFPNVYLRFCGQRFLWGKDRDLALLCVQAYNDWLAEEWAAESAGRLLGAALVPLWDPELCAAEVLRNAARGCKAVCFSEIPSRLELPSMYSGEWDPFFSACEETGTVIMMHIGSSSTRPEASPEAPPILGTANAYVNSSLSLTDWILSGQFVKFPRLRVAYAEAQAGWLPFIMTRLDNVWKKGNRPVFRPLGGSNPLIDDLPSSYLKDHVYLCLFDDSTAFDYLDFLGADSLCFETDYPHPDSNWPHSRQVAAALTADISDELRLKVLRTNALELLGVPAGRAHTGSVR